MANDALAGRYLAEGQSDLIQLVGPGGNSLLNISNGGKFTTCAGLPLVNSGVPSQVASIDLYSQGAALSNQPLYTVAQTDKNQVGDFYSAFFTAKVTQAASSSSTLGGTSGITYSYTAEDGYALSSIPAVLNGNVGHNDLTSTVATGLFTMFSLVNTPITFSFGYISSGATPMLYSLHIRLFRL